MEPRRASEEQLHRVEITKPYWMSTYPVTQVEYQRVIGERPSAFGADGREGSKVLGIDTSRLPVESVSWDDAVEFCARLSNQLQGDGTVLTFRLPTEAEWEYACRAHTTTAFHFGGALAGEHANCDGKQPYGTSIQGDSIGHPTNVGNYPPNAFGLFDMHGNVWEWCHDWYSVNAYARSSLRDPRGPTSGTCRVVRGGAWATPARFCRAAAREWYSPSRRLSSLGFRVAAVARPR
jgi:formylglycine-generating enzyme required for sulfatase activity